MRLNFVHLNHALKSSLNSREQSNTLRCLKNIAKISANLLQINGQEYINFASNDYLGLSNSSLLKEASIKYINLFGVGATASRLMSSNLELYANLESKIARFKGSESALILNSGFAGNFSVIEALGRISIVLMDKLAHKSIILGASLNDFKRFKHNDIDDLQIKIESLRPGKNVNKFPIIVTESVFSMDGDLCDINSIVNIADLNSAAIYIDEAHATGVFGHNGSGLMHVNKDNQIVFGTFSKAFGSFGAYIACSNLVKQYLVNYCSSLIYSTSLPPSVLGSIEAGLDLVPELNNDRSRLMGMSNYLRQELNAIGFDTGHSRSQIIPIIFKSNDIVKKISNYLNDNFIFAPVILPPTVNNPRIRFSLTSCHTESQIDYLLLVLKRYLKNNRHIDE